jgi:hypothetical protein
MARGVYRHADWAKPSVGSHPIVRTRIESLEGFSIEATDGRIGKVYALLFDGLTWSVRYLVVDTGTW